MASSKWNDIDCNDSNFFICMFDEDFDIFHGEIDELLENQTSTIKTTIPT